ncbi:MAG: N-acetyltransferase [Nitrospirae bacterium]|nr:N-acetyltransferase [Nitrospirota bacterium]
MLEVLAVNNRSSFKEFLNLPFKLYDKNPFWVPPLLKDLKEQFSPQNPFLKHAEIAPFIAKIDGKTVGRITAIYNSAHIDFHNEAHMPRRDTKDNENNPPSPPFSKGGMGGFSGEKTGFFGFFECIDYPVVAKALLERVKQWLREKGITILRGPVNFSTNDECGLLIDGYNCSPMIMMPYNPSYYSMLLEQCGFAKAKDLYAYIIDVPKTILPEKVFRVVRIAEKHNITVRHINIKSFRQEMEIFKSIYNSAWERNWGFVPMTDEEIDHEAKKLKPIIIPELTLIAECRGQPVGFMMMLPDFNYVLKKLNGRLFPFGILKALWYSRKIKDLRLLLLGIKEGFRKQGVDAFLLMEGLRALKNGGYERVEFSWVLEDNVPVQKLAGMFSGRLYKVYRIYETKI